MRRYSLIALLTGPLMMAAPLWGCHSPLLRTPTRFMELNESGHKPYDYRATSADGVVLAGRALDMDPERGGDLQFWVDATTRRMRSRGGYALLKVQKVKTINGLVGKQLRFGHDEKGKPYQYWLTLFAAADQLFVIEAGGPSEDFDNHRSAIDAAIASFDP